MSAHGEYAIFRNRCRYRITVMIVRVMLSNKKNDICTNGFKTLALIPWVATINVSSAMTGIVSVSEHAREFETHLQLRKSRLVARQRTLAGKPSCDRLFFSFFFLVAHFFFFFSFTLFCVPLLLHGFTCLFFSIGIY